jgi:crotonobetainyl-CoA:carnitine CoA-transferase CaiB-like acyl-CoA transferase
VRIIAGPTVGVILASFGADVIRVNCSRLADLNVSIRFTRIIHERIFRKPLSHLSLSPALG